jgi:O-methyltransferase involved in polyketide biosynthesis
VTSGISLTDEMSTPGEGLAALRADFPGFKIWEEFLPGRSRYVARSLREGVRPHTVVTPDLGELRSALEAGGRAHVVPFSAAQPNIARMYDYWLQGKDHYPADRAAALAVMQKFPEVATIAQANRAFLVRAVRHVARQGVTQLIDFGAGLPASPNTHEVAREITPDARVCYVDNDQLVLAHARAMLEVDGHVSVTAGDLRAPEAALADPAIDHLIDARTPTCVLMVSVLHFLTPKEADAAVAAVRRWLAPGSYLVISAGTSTGTDPEFIKSLEDAYAETAPISGRTAEEIAAWFDGFTLARPGLTDVWDWRHSGPRPAYFPGPPRARFLAGVGRKTSGTAGWVA